MATSCVDPQDELARLRRENGELRALCEQQRRYIDARRARGGDAAAEEVHEEGVGDEDDDDVETVPSMRDGTEDEDAAAERERVAALLRPPPLRDGISAAATQLGANVALEFTRDSPMFRRQLEAFQESLDGLGTFLAKTAQLARVHADAAARADETGQALAAHMAQREHVRAHHSRALLPRVVLTPP